jgi:hypothetical protein
MKLRMRLHAFVLGTAALLAGHANAGSGTFNTLTYNIAGTPTAYNGYSTTNTALISCYVKPFSIVNVQEDFLWHATLYDTCDNHPYRTPTSGTAGIGDGLNTLSSFWFDDLDRVTWTNRADSDALTPKGFSLVRVRLAEGTYVDFYNLHAQSGTSSTDLTDSESDVNQMLTYIEANSAGNTSWSWAIPTPAIPAPARTCGSSCVTASATPGSRTCAAAAPRWTAAASCSAVRRKPRGRTARSSTRCCGATMAS